MTCVFSSSGWAATYSTLPVFAKLRSCCRIAAPAEGSTPWAISEEPARTATPIAAWNATLQRMQRHNTEGVIDRSHDSTHPKGDPIDPRPWSRAIRTTVPLRSAIGQGRAIRNRFETTFAS